MLDLLTNKKIRLIFSNTLSARENMAIDEALFASFEENSMPIFRVYDWEKSFTVGISQDFSNIPEFDERKSYKNNFAKRITGGGVLFHGHDVSYSLLIPMSYFKSLNVKSSYEKICTFLLEFYKSLGLNAMYAKDDENTTLSKSAFCQVGFEAYDILVNGKKIGGNAQRRTKKFIFQHGSIALTKPSNNTGNEDENKEEMGFSLHEFDINLDINDAKKRVMDAFEKTFKIEFEESCLTLEEKEKLKILLKDKYDYEKQ